MSTFYLALILILLYGATLFGLRTVLRILNRTREREKNLASSLAALEDRYKGVIDLEAFQANLRQELTSLQSENQIAASVQDDLQRKADDLKKQIDLYTEEQGVIDCGFYTPVYDFDISQKYKDALEDVRVRQKNALKDKVAAHCSQTYTVNGNVKEGKKLSDHYMSLMLRAFNGECDALVASVRWNNIQRMIERLEGVYQSVNKLGESHAIKIERSYFQLKLKELQLTYEYQEKLKAEKDEQRRIAEQIREEERAQKEFEKQVRDSEEEERRSRIALEKARQELAQAQGDQVAKMNEKIQVLEAQLAEALTNKERAKSMAQMTKCGHVYVISNIGSFGNNRFKIGMTRRYEPTDRIDELSNASVPFEFDVHAMIYSENAPQLESQLHQRFGDQRVNLANKHKEYFDVSLDEIAQVVREYDATIDFITVPEAKSYRQSLAMRGLTSETAPEVHPAPMVPANGVSPVSETAPTAVEDPAVQALTVSPETPVQIEQFYVSQENLQYGPFTREQIQAYIASGQFNAQSGSYWQDGMAQWEPLSSL